MGMTAEFSPEFAEMLETALAGRGYFVDTAGSGAEAAGKFIRDGFDLVITDIQMPGTMSGNDLARTIRCSTFPFPSRFPCRPRWGRFPGC